VPRFHKAALIPQVTSLLAGEVAERGRRVVLVLDEAHFLSRAQLEELRLLTNAEMDSTSPFALVLLGQPGAAPLSRHLRRARVAHHAALRDPADERRGMLELRSPPPPPRQT